MTVTIGRRELLVALGGAAAAWPLAALAQQPAMPVVGYLSAHLPGPSAPLTGAFRQGLKESGYVDGENMTIIYRWAEGQWDRLPALATELLHQRVAVTQHLEIVRRSRPRRQPRRSPSSSASAMTRSGLVLSPASPSPAATSQGSIISRMSWRQSAWSSCVRWCLRPLALPCSSAPPMLRLPSPR